MDGTPTYGQQAGPPQPGGDPPPPPLPWLLQEGPPAPWPPPPMQAPPAGQYPSPPYPSAPPQVGPPQAAPPQAAPPQAAPPQMFPPQPYPPAAYPAPPPSSGPPPASAPSGRRRWVPVVAGVLVVLLLVAGGAVAWRVLSDDDPAPTAAPTAAAPAPPAGQDTAAASPSAPADGLSDEFDGTALSEPKWGIYGSTSPNGSVWSRDAVTVQDGILRITGTGRNPTGSGNVAGGVCQCGPGGNRTSGVWTVRARFDAGAGYGPGLMLWPQSDKASDGFATFAGVNDPARRSVRSLVMWGTAGGKAEASLSGDFTGWHVYRVEWRPGSLKMYVDEALLFDSASRPGTVVPSTPMHLVIQVVAGPKDGVPAANAGTPDKVVTEVDWVRYTP